MKPQVWASELQNKQHQPDFVSHSFPIVFWEGLERSWKSQRLLLRSGVDFHLCTGTGLAEPAISLLRASTSWGIQMPKGRGFHAEQGLLSAWFSPFWDCNWLARMAIFIKGKSEIHLCVRVANQSFLVCQLFNWIKIISEFATTKFLRAWSALKIQRPEFSL